MSRYAAGTFVHYRGQIVPVLDCTHGLPAGLLPVWLGDFRDGKPVMTYASLAEVRPYAGSFPVRMDSPPNPGHRE